MLDGFLYVPQFSERTGVASDVGRSAPVHTSVDVPVPTLQGAFN